MLKSDIKRGEDGALHVALEGKIDQYFDGRDILKAADAAKRVVLRLDGVRSISSLGVRALEAFMKALGDREVFLDDISAALANQVAMIPNLVGRATVRSVKLPFVCPSCGHEGTFAVPYQPDAAQTHAPKCPQCSAKMDFDGFSEEYLPH